MISKAMNAAPHDEISKGHVEWHAGTEGYWCYSLETNVLVDTGRTEAISLLTRPAWPSER